MKKELKPKVSQENNETIKKIIPETKQSKSEWTVGK